MGEEEIVNLEETRKKLNLPANHDAIWQFMSNLNGILLGILEAGVTNPIQLDAMKKNVSREIYRCRNELCGKVTKE